MGAGVVARVHREVARVDLWLRPAGCCVGRGSRGAVAVRAAVRRRATVRRRDATVREANGSDDIERAQRREREAVLLVDDLHPLSIIALRIFRRRQRGVALEHQRGDPGGHGGGLGGPEVGLRHSVDGIRDDGRSRRDEGELGVAVREAGDLVEHGRVVPARGEAASPPARCRSRSWVARARPSSRSVAPTAIAPVLHAGADIWVANPRCPRRRTP